MNWIDTWCNAWPEEIKNTVWEFRHAYYLAENLKERIKRSDDYTQTEALIEDLRFFEEQKHRLTYRLMCLNERWTAGRRQ